MKLCKDCKWNMPEDNYSDSSAQHWARCGKTKKITNVVTGDDKYNLCAIERGSGGLFAYLEGVCGRQGRFWEDA